MDIYSFFSGKIRNLVRNNLIEREQQLLSQSKGIHWGDEIVGSTIFFTGPWQARATIA